MITICSTCGHLQIFHWPISIDFVIIRNLEKMINENIGCQGEKGSMLFGIYQRGRSLRHLPNKQYSEISPISLSIDPIQIPILPNLPHLSPHQKQLQKTNQALISINELLHEMANYPSLLFFNKLQLISTHCNSISMNINQLLHKIKIVFETVFSEQIGLQNSHEQMKKQFEEIYSRYTQQKEEILYKDEEKRILIKKMDELERRSQQTIYQLRDMKHVIKEMNYQIQKLQSKLIQKQQQIALDKEESEALYYQFIQTQEQNKFCTQLLDRILNSQNLQQQEELKQLLQQAQKQTKKWKERYFQEQTASKQHSQANTKIKTFFSRILRKQIL